MAKGRAATRQDGGATDVVGGGEDIGLLSLRGLVDATTSAMNPLTTVRESARLYGEWLKIMAGQSTREVPAKDWRFADPTWREHPVYKRLAQGTSHSATQSTRWSTTVPTGASANVRGFSPVSSRARWRRPTR
jgi:hypothetical protein